MKVSGTIDGSSFAATLMPSGDGLHWLPLKAALCKLVGNNKERDLVTVQIERRLS